MSDFIVSIFILTHHLFFSISSLYRFLMFNHKVRVSLVEHEHRKRMSTLVCYADDDADNEDATVTCIKTTRLSSFEKNWRANKIMCFFLPSAVIWSTTFGLNVATHVLWTFSPKTLYQIFRNQNIIYFANYLVPVFKCLRGWWYKFLEIILT